MTSLLEGFTARLLRGPDREGVARSYTATYLNWIRKSLEPARSMTPGPGLDRLPFMWTGLASRRRRR